MTILQRDVRDIANIADLTAIPPSAPAHGKPRRRSAEFADLSRGLGLPQTTLKRYFALLKTTFLVELLARLVGAISASA